MTHFYYAIGGIVGAAIVLLAIAFVRGEKP
jgi:hypothetical protein